MIIELLGFFTGISVIAGLTVALVSHEQWKTIRSAYGRDGQRGGGGNALIWPSR